MNAAEREVSRVLVVDDHPLVLEGFAHILDRETDLQVSWLAGSAREALDVLRSHKPDLATVDIRLGRTSGIDLIRQMKALLPSLVILAVSMYEEGLYAERAIRAGARGFLSKLEAAENIVTAMRCVRDGEIYMSERLQRGLVERVFEGSAMFDDEPLMQLSARELEVFQLIGTGLKKSEIALHLRISINTVETHRSGIKRKLKVSTGADLARVAFLHLQQVSSAARRVNGAAQSRN